MSDHASMGHRSSFERLADASRARSSLSTDPQLAALMGTVDAIAADIFRRLGRRIELEELKGVGYLAAVECQHRFDPSVGASLVTFAWRRIEGAMIDRARKERWFNELRFAVGAHTEALRETLDLTDRDAAWDSGSATHARWAAQAVGRAAIFAMARRAFDPEAASDECERWELYALLDRCMKALPDDQRQVLRRLWADGWSLADIGAELGVSKEYARRLNLKAIDNMRRLMGSASIREDVSTSTGADATGRKG